MYMKRFKSLIIILCCASQFTWAFEGNSTVPGETGTAAFTLYQSDNGKKERMVYAGVGIVLGVFSPRQVNDYIEDDLPSNIFLTMGTTDMIANFNLRLSLTVRPHRVIDIVPFAEFGWAPKFISVEYEDSYYYSFTKVAPGLATRIHVPFGSGRHSLFFAPGVSYDILSFKDDSRSVAKAAGLGLRFHAGFNLGLGKVLIQPFVGFEYARAIDEEYYGGFELSFSSFQLGVDFCF